MDKNEKRDFWAERLAAWKASGLSQVGWCRETGVKLATLRYWQQKLEAPSALPNFRRLSVEEETAGLILELGGWRIRLNSGFDRQALGEVLDFLESRRC